ncbi:MAG: amino acid ABC transporter permease [Verrucomicrobiales bacterium]
MKSRRGWHWTVAIVLIALFSWFCVALLWHLAPEWDWRTLWRYRIILWRGWLLTLIISVSALFGSTLVGLLLMLGQRSGIAPLKIACRSFLELVRETPLLVQLLIGYFLIFAPLFGRELGRLDVDDKVIIGILLLSLFEGAYLGEILRGGIESIPRTQWDSARAVGFDRYQVYRYVIFPQGIRRVLPALAGLFVSLIKDSSLLMVIGVQEFTYQSNVYKSKTYGGIEAYVPLAVGYLILTLPIAWASHALEKRFRYET